MISLRIIFHLARADFLERSRRYSFLVVLGLVVFLGYQVAIGNMGLQLGHYRGEFNSAWVGAMMTIIATFFLGWFGFYVVKGSIARDRETGVGQIIATTPIKRPLYVIGKWISNFVVLMAMTTVLALAGIIIQLLQGESTQFDLKVFLEPFIYIVMPLLALVAALAALFETIPFLSGGFGNIVYFFMFIMSLPLMIEVFRVDAVYEPLGLKLVSDQMGADVVKIYPDYDGSFTLGTSDTEVTGIFNWDGIKWTPSMILGRFSFIAFGLMLALLASIFFDRFDPSRSKPRRMKNAASNSVEPLPVQQIPAPSVRLTPLNRSAGRFSFFNVFTAELKLMVKGQRWWWYFISAGLIVAGFVNSTETTLKALLPIAWIWHMLLLSPLGSRESHDNVQQLAFSSASPLWRQLPAQWLAGFIVTLVMGGGAALNFIIHGEMSALYSLLAGAVFIPSLALALGIWSGTSKVFEVVYVTLWYIGPMNSVPPLDYTGASGMNNPTSFILFSILLLVIAFFGRSKQLQN